MKYYARINKQKDGKYLVEFLDLPGCLTEGKTLAMAIINAEEALSGWLASHCDRNMNVLDPKTRKGRDFYPISVDLRVAFAVLLRKVRIKKGLTQNQVASLLGISQQAYARMEIPSKTNPSLSTVQNISKVLNTKLEFDLAA